jgi:hypothetical protein
MEVSDQFHTLPGERAPDTHWIGDWVSPSAVLDAVVKRKIPSSQIPSDLVQLGTSYLHGIILDALSQCVDWLRAKRLGFDSRQVQVIFFSFLQHRNWSVKLITSRHLLPEVEDAWILPPIIHVSSCRGV